MRPSTVPRTPRPVEEEKPSTGARTRPRSSAARTTAAASGCSLPRSRLAARRRASGSSRPSRPTKATRRRAALGQRAGLVHDQRVHAREDLEGLGVLHEDAGRRSPAHAHHDRHRRREAEGAGAGDDEDGDGGHERVGEARLGPDERPGDEGERRDGEDGGDEPGGHGVGEALDGRAAPLGLGHELDDPREERLLPDLLGAHDEAAGAVERGAGHARPRPLLHRHGLAGDHRLVDAASSPRGRRRPPAPSRRGGRGGGRPAGRRRGARRPRSRRRRGAGRSSGRGRGGP